MSVLRQKIKGCVQYYPVRSKAWKELQYKRMKLGEWPPSNSSPLHPIEPWGKQFFVFNTLLEGKSETLLCVTDHSRKPLMYLYKEDFQAIVFPAKINYFQKLYMENIKNELNRLENISRQEDGRYEELLLDSVTRSYSMQRMKTGRHSSHTIMRSTCRIKK